MLITMCVFFLHTHTCMSAFTHTHTHTRTHTHTHTHSHTHTHTHTHAHALAQVLRLNHIGDWGTQFGMLIQHMNELNPGSAGGDAGQGESISDLMALYRYA